MDADFWIGMFDVKCIKFALLHITWRESRSGEFVENMWKCAAFSDDISPNGIK